MDQIESLHMVYEVRKGINDAKEGSIRHRGSIVDTTKRLGNSRRASAAAKAKAKWGIQLVISIFP